MVIGYETISAQNLLLTSLFSSNQVAKKYVSTRMNHLYGGPNDKKGVSEPLKMVHGLPGGMGSSLLCINNRFFHTVRSGCSMLENIRYKFKSCVTSALSPTSDENAFSHVSRLLARRVLEPLVTPLLPDLKPLDGFTKKQYFITETIFPWESLLQTP